MPRHRQPILAYPRPHRRPASHPAPEFRPLQVTSIQLSGGVLEEQLMVVRPGDPDYELEFRLAAVRARYGIPIPYTDGGVEG
ncbi:MAG TPA: hypothetical protein VNL71_18055 [Chloroflexota bacterium]|nr:hypothetical protein [Chloroflexota bacterium]